MKSTIAALTSDIDALLAGIETLLKEHSGVYRFNEPGSGIIFMSGNYSWRELPDAGRQLQTKLLTERAHLFPLLKLVTRHCGPAEQRALDEALNQLDGMIGQKHAGWLESIPEAVERTRTAISGIKTVLGATFDSAPGQTLFVADTNALYSNPQLEEWRFEEASVFQVVLVPIVLADLDRHKVAHQNPDIREKAKGLIRRIKGYRSRGSLNDGVPLVNGVSTLRSVATEPLFEKTLHWLSATSDDDRLLAAAYELMLANPHCRVVLVTGDINLQNKAEFARLPFVEPPPSASNPAKQRRARKRP